MNSEEELRALWRRHARVTLRLSPEELRALAQKSDSQARRRYLADQVSFGLFIVICTLGTVLLPAGKGPLARLGIGMLALWSVWGLYARHRFASVLPAPTDPAAAGVVAWAIHHRQQLLRQRDYVLSWPLGIALAAPGVVLLVLDLPLGPRHVPWPWPVAVLGVCAFLFVACVIYGRVLAARRQHEIDALDSMTVDPMPAEGPGADFD